MGSRFGSAGSREFRGSNARRLARISSESIDFPEMFGGGYESARNTCRIPCVVFGYPAVLEEFENVDAKVFWSALSVSLGGRVPRLCIDHSERASRRRIPVPDPVRAVGVFDNHFTVTGDAEIQSELVTPELRALLLRSPVQRLDFSGTRLLIRTFDGIVATPNVLDQLTEQATAVLQATPAYTSRLHAGERRPFPRGVVGLAD